MEHDEARKVEGQIQGITADGWLRNIKTDDDGRVLTTGGAIEIPEETTLICEIVEEEKTYEFDEKISSISVANYSETDDLIISVDTQNMIVGANIAIDLPINFNVHSISLTSKGTEIKAQLAVKVVV